MQSGILANDPIGKIERRDVVDATLGLRVPRGNGQRGGQKSESAMQSSHARARSIRDASAKPASAAAVMASTPAPRGTPASCVSVTAPSAVLSTSGRIQSNTALK